jgi:hypothetical protein
MFKVVLTNGSEDYSLIFKLRNTAIAEKWYAELSKSYQLDEVDRFSNWGENNVIEELNSIIDKINSYQYIIDKKVDHNINQNDLNYLHKFFELYRGEMTEKTQWYNSAPGDIQTAISRYNVLIHLLESNLRTKNQHPTMVVTFKDAPRIKLSKNDLKYFTYKWSSGTVYINYCIVGKTVLDAYKDHDSIGAIRPQTHYAADFMIKFGPSTNIFFYFLRSMLIKIWLIKNKIKFKNLNLGMIPVADIDQNLNINEVKKFNRVKEVICIK